MLRSADSSTEILCARSCHSSMTIKAMNTSLDGYISDRDDKKKSGIASIDVALLAEWFVRQPHDPHKPGRSTLRRRRDQSALLTPIVRSRTEQ